MIAHVLLVLILINITTTTNNTAPKMPVIFYLTALVPAALWSAGKKYGAAWSRITDAREEQKRSR